MKFLSCFLVPASILFSSCSTCCKDDTCWEVTNWRGISPSVEEPELVRVPCDRTHPDKVWVPVANSNHPDSGVDIIWLLVDKSDPHVFTLQQTGETAFAGYLNYDSASQDLHQPSVYVTSVGAGLGNYTLTRSKCPCPNPLTGCLTNDENIFQTPLRLKK